MKEKEKRIELELNRERRRGKKRIAIVTHLNHILMTEVLALFYLRVVRKGKYQSNNYFRIQVATRTTFHTVLLYTIFLRHQNYFLRHQK